MPFGVEQGRSRGGREEAMDGEKRWGGGDLQRGHQKKQQSREDALSIVPSSLPKKVFGEKQGRQSREWEGPWPWHDMAWHGKSRHGMAGMGWHGWYDMAWHGCMSRHNMVLYGMVWHGMAWHSMVGMA